MRRHCQLVHTPWQLANGSEHHKNYAKSKPAGTRNFYSNYENYGQLLRYGELCRRALTISPDCFPDADGFKFDWLCFGWFNLYLNPFFKGIMNLAMKILGCACGTCYIQNGDGGMRSRLSHPLWMGQFNLCLDPNFEEILNLKGKFVILAVVPYMVCLRIMLKMRGGWISLIGVVQLVSRPIFQEIKN